MGQQLVICRNRTALEVAEAVALWQHGRISSYAACHRGLFASIILCFYISKLNRCYRDTVSLQGSSSPRTLNTSLLPWAFSSFKEVRNPEEYKQCHFLKKILAKINIVQLWRIKWSSLNKAALTIKGGKWMLFLHLFYGYSHAFNCSLLLYQHLLSWSAERINPFASTHATDKAFVFTV